MESNPLAVTVATARKLSGLGNTKLWELISEGKLDSVQVGRRRLILYQSLEALLRLPEAKTKQAAPSSVAKRYQVT